MNRFFLPGTFFIGTLILLFVYSQGSLKGRATASKKGKVPYLQVHQYKQETAMKIGIKKDEARFMKESQKGHIEHNEDYHRDHSSSDLTPEKNIGRDIMDRGSYKGAVTLDQKMDDFLAQRQMFQEAEEIKKKAYVEQFKLEARKMGFQVEIDENMQITSVKKIK